MKIYKDLINSKIAKIFFVIISVINTKIIFSNLISISDDNKLIIILFLFVVISNLFYLWNPNDKFLNQNTYLRFVTITLLLFIVIIVLFSPYYGFNFLNMIKF